MNSLMVIYSQCLALNHGESKVSKTLKQSMNSSPKHPKHQSFSRSFVYTDVTKENFQSLIARRDFNTSAPQEFEITQYFPTAIAAGIIKHVH